jgi:hypothetical protein
MISKQSAPVGWSMLMYELEDAKEHLANLILAMDADAEYDEVNLRIDLGHVFSHLNRAWHRRDVPEDLTEDQWKKASQFPDDLSPI